jgi:hypothetical protein
VKCKRERFLPRAAVKCVALRLLQVLKTGCREYGTTYLLEQYGMGIHSAVTTLGGGHTSCQ